MKKTTIILLFLGLILSINEVYSQEYIKFHLIQRSGLSIFDKTLLYDYDYADKVIDENPDTTLMFNFISKKSYKKINKILVENYEFNQRITDSIFHLQIFFYNFKIKKYCYLYLPFDNDAKSFFSKLTWKKNKTLKLNKEITKYLNNYDEDFLIELKRP